MHYLCSLFLVWLFCLGLASAGADAPAQKPAVSFSPSAVNFGRVPSNTQCTQLLTVTLDRHVFSPEHLPTLLPDRASQADVSLFARFDGPNFIRVVYRVTVNAYFQIGPFQDHLILVDDTKRSADYPLGAPVKDASINVVGESVQGLEAPTQPVDFGNVNVGASKNKPLTVGFYAPPMAHSAPSWKI